MTNKYRLKYTTKNGIYHKNVIIDPDCSMCGCIISYISVHNSYKTTKLEDGIINNEHVIAVQYEPLKESQKDETIEVKLSTLWLK